MSDRDILPKDLSPVNYNLLLDQLDTEKLTYHGQQTVQFEVANATNKVHFNYKKGLKIGAATADGAAVKSIEYNDETEVVVLELSSEVKAGSKLELSFDFTNAIQTNMAGFYRSEYKDKGSDEKKIMLSTQFESSDARRAFPCVDEPNQKATFEFAIEIPHEGWTALSNMPIKSESTTKAGKKLVVFDKAPKMSTYLFAWALGEFEYIEDFTDHEYEGKKLPVRVYTTKGLKEQGKVALEAGRKIIDYFSQVFGIDYVLPKCDLLAVHEFTHGAMENWGLITYRTTALLFDEATSENDYLTRVVYVVAHELAHQWFGNLVTMDWWNELWLNEGFATWVGWFAVDHLYPEWDVFSRFAAESLQGALGLDALRGSHPIEVPVRSGLEVDQVFDSISYLKGASSIRMLSTHLGVEVFLKGVSRYLKKHAYGNAKTTDLWDALSQESGLDVASFMNSWTNKIGFPVLRVDAESEHSVKVTQKRFLASGDVKADEDTTVWWVPLELSSGLSAEPRSVALTDRSSVVSNLGPFFKFNKDQVGVYRVNYSDELLQRIGGHHNELSNKDKVGLVADTAASASAGLAKTSTLLSLLKDLAVPAETDHYVWSEIAARIGSIRTAWSESDKDVQDAISAFTRKLIGPVVKTLRWTTSSDDSYQYIELRALILSVAVAVKVPEVVAEAQARFAKYLAGDKTAIHPSLRRAVYTANIKYNEGSELEKTYNHFVNELYNSETVDGKELAASTLGKVTDPVYVQKNIDLIRKVKVPMQDVHSLIGNMARNSAARNEQWQYVQTEWDQIVKDYGSNMIIFERIVRLVLSGLVTEKQYNEVVAFFKNKDQKGYDRAVQQALDLNKTKYQWTQRDTENLKLWLSSA